MSFVSAQQGEGLLGGLENQIFDTFNNIINYELKIPNISGNATDTYPVWSLLLSFTLLFTVLWVVSQNIPPFKGMEKKGPVKMFAIALSLLVLFSTPFLKLILVAVGTFTTLAYLGILVVGGYMIYVLTRSGIASGFESDVKSSQTLATAGELSAQVSRQKAQTEEFKEKTERAIHKGFTNQISAINSLRTDLGSLLGRFQKWNNKFRNGSYPSGSTVPPKEVKEAVKIVGKISQDIGKIISFKTDNDRIMSGMRSKNYADSATGTINSNSEVVKIKKDLDTQTNDLGRSIAGIAESLQKEIKQNVVEHLVAWTESSINITNRMSRDIVLEDQMLDKL